MSSSDDGVFLWNDTTPPAAGGVQWYVNLYNMASNAQWLNHPDNYKLVAYENGIITSITNTNSLNNC